MPLGRAWSVALVGLDGRLVEVEADLGGGLPGIKMIGLPDAGRREAKDRVRSAIRNSGQHWPEDKLTLGLFPANLPKLGSAYDLAIAVAIQWSRSDERQQRRRDRHVDRVGDVELDAYNEELQRLAERDARVASRGN